MKIPMTILDVEEKESKVKTMYAQAQVIIHDPDGVTAGPCSFFGNSWEKLKAIVKKDTKYMAHLKLQPGRNGTEVEILDLLPFNPVSQAAAAK